MKPRIVIPSGDPAGIGGEIVLKAICDPEVRAAADCIIIGSAAVYRDLARRCGMEFNLPIVGENEIEEGICFLDMGQPKPEDFEYGVVSPVCGRAAYGYIQKSVELCQRDLADAVATTPINKEALRAAGVPYIGHTEIYAALTGTDDPLTMFETGDLRVFFLTRHVSLRKMLDMIKKERIIDYVLRCKRALDRLGVGEGTMAIAGLNPHSGEHGLFGTEEVEEIIPAVEELRRRGIDVAGPIGADSVFHQAAQGKYNSVLSLYHDQGHIATKTLDFERTIALTNDMPFLRTSVDHGTAFDIAGRGIASGVSMKEAILIAARYALAYKRTKV